MLIAAALLAAACTATDGDTIRCGAERIRLIGIDAAELHGPCRRRICPPGDARQAKARMAQLLRRRPIVIRRFGRDRYGRTLALVSAGGVDLGCAQLRTGAAVYRADWDQAGRLRSGCNAPQPRNFR